MTALKTISLRQKREKELLLEQFKKIPIVQIACEKVGVGRATYYRWRKEDPNFKKASDESLEEGASLINDMAESQLLSAIKDKNLTAIIFWLKHHHAAYTTRVELIAAKKIEDDVLTEEQKNIISGALSVLHTQTEDKNY